MATHTSPDCTAAAVTSILIAAGFSISTPGEFGPGWRSGGVYAADLPMSEPRVAVYFWPGHLIAGRCEDVAEPLRAAGYRVERVADCPRDYLVVWTEGDF